MDIGGLIIGGMGGAGEGMATVGLAQVKAKIEKDRAATIEAIRAENAMKLEGVRQTAETERQKAGFEHADTTLGKQQQFTQTENAANREAADARASEALIRDEQQHGERMAAMNKAAQQQAAQINLEQQKVDMLAATNALDVAQKKAIADARQKYVAETDPDKKIERGNEYMTLLGKTGERYKAIESTDPMTGAKTITGFVDQSSGRVLGPQGKGSPKSGGAQWDQESGDVLVNGVKVGTAASKEEAIAIARRARSGTIK